MLNANNDILTVLDQLGFEYKIDSSEKNVILRRCPFCYDDNWHFYIGIDSANLGLWTCFKCSGAALGSEPKVWVKLKKYLLGEESDIITPAIPTSEKDKTNFNYLMDKVLQYNKDLFCSESAMTYLRERGIYIDSIKKYKLGYVNKDNVAYLSIPYFYKHTLVDIKFRTLPPSEKRFVRLPNGKSILFNYDNIDLKKNYIYICEGELDAITLAQHGEENVVSVTVGAKNFKPEWYDLLRCFKIIYFCFDNDGAGQEGAEILADRLGLERCYNILLPYVNNIKDINDYFRYYDIDDFKSLTRSASVFTIKNIYTVEHALTDIERRYSKSGKALEGLDTPWGVLNDKLGVIARGDLVFLTARPKTGKTTFALNLCYYYSFVKHLPTLFFCLEMPPDRLAMKLISLHRKVPDNLIKYDDIVLTRADFLQKDVPMYFGYTTDRSLLAMDKIFNILGNARKKYGFEFIVFDNLQYLARSIQFTTREVAAISREFKLFALNHRIHVMVIAQPRRISQDSVTTSEHIRDSSAPEADADSIIVMNRKSLAVNRINDTSSLEYDTVQSPIVRISVDKSRYSCGGIATLYFDGEKSYFREATKEELESL